MNIEQIITKLAQLESDYNDKISDLYNEDLEFLNDFVLNSNIRNIYNYINLSAYDYILACLLTFSDKYTYKDLDNELYFFRAHTDDYKSYETFFDNCFDSAQDLFQLYDSSDDEEQEKIISKLKEDIDNNSSLYYEGIESIIRNSEKIEMDLYKKIIKIYLEDSELMKEIYEEASFILETIMAIKAVINSLDNLERHVKNGEMRIPSSKDLKKVKEKLGDKKFVEYALNHTFISNEDLKVFIPDIENNDDTVEMIERIQNRIDAISNYVSDNKRKNKKNINTYRKQINYIKSIIADLKRFSKSKYISIPNDLENLDDEELRIMILQEIYFHNKEYSDSLKLEYEKLDRGQNKYNRVFKKFNINIDQYNFDTNLSEGELELILIKLTSLGIKSTELILSIIKNSTVEIISRIDEYIEEGYLTKKFVVSNLEIYIKDENYFLNITKNIERLSNYGISPLKISQNQNMIKCDYKLIEENLLIISKYNLINYIGSANNLNFLSKNDLNKKIDKLLENGLENIISKNLDLLSYDYERIKRIDLVKPLYDDPDIIIKIIKDNNFNLGSSNIDDYIYNYMTINTFSSEEKVNIEEIKKKLETYSKTPLTYNINGVIISKNKINDKLDQYNNEINIRDFLNNLLDGTVVSEDEFNLIKSEFISYSK